MSTSLEQQVTQSGQRTCQMDEAQLESRASSQGLLLQNGHMSAVFKKPRLCSDLLTLELTVLMCWIMGIAAYDSWSLAGMKSQQELQVPVQSWASSQQPCRAHPQQQGLALVGIINNAIHFGVSLSRS